MRVNVKLLSEKGKILVFCPYLYKTQIYFFLRNDKKQL